MASLLQGVQTTNSKCVHRKEYNTNFDSSRSGSSYSAKIRLGEYIYIYSITFQHNGSRPTKNLPLVHTGGSGSSICSNASFSG